MNDGLAERVAKLEGILEGHRQVSDERHTSTTAQIGELRRELNRGIQELRDSVTQNRVRLGILYAVSSAIGSALLVWMPQLLTHGGNHV